MSDKVTLDEQIRIFEDNAEHVRKEGDLMECLWFRQLANWLKDYKRLIETPCEDAISREEAIRIASGYCHWSNIPEELAKLPSVQPKAKVGHWGILEECSNEGIYCSVCHKKVHRLDFVPKVKFKYCPNCGAKMAESEE
jgi:hypothetical protein